MDKIRERNARDRIDERETCAACTGTGDAWPYRCGNCNGTGEWRPTYRSLYREARADVAALLGEVERLRAALALVTHCPPVFWREQMLWCAYCGATSPSEIGFTHDPTCSWAQARAALGAEGTRGG